MDSATEQRILLVDGWVDLVRREVRRGDEVHHLSATEARLVAYLVAHADQTHDRSDLLVHVWGYRPGVRSRTVDTTMLRLRNKLEIDPSEPRHLITVYGAGYRFEPVEAETEGFFGRRAELARLRAWWRGDPRVVSLVGPGGIGKTRLAVQAAGPDACFCDLTTATTEWDLVRVVAGVLGVPLGAHLSLDAAMAQIGLALADRGRIRLILDNAEQVVGPLRRWLPRWVEGAPAVTWLVTSREALELEGEQVLAVPSLEDEPALALLEARARDVRPDFDVRACRDDALALVHRLQAQPLAIELAASRLDLLSPRALLARLPALDLLARSDGPERHRTLQGVIEQSWALLAPEEQHGLVACATFAGAFTADAAEALLGARALDVLRALRRQSLLRAEPSALLGGDLRFSLFAGVREFASAHLEHAPTRDALRAAHRRWFLDVGARARDGVASPDGVARIAQLQAAADDLLLVHDRDATTHPADAARAALYLEPLMSAGIPVGRGLELLDSALAAARRAGSATLEAEVLRMRGVLRPLQGLLDAALRDLARAEALAGDDAALAAQIDLAVGSVHCRRGQLDEAEGPLVRAAEVARTRDDQVLEARALHGLGVLRRMQARLVDAEACYLAAMRIYRALGDRWFATATLGSLSNVYLDLGRYVDADVTNAEAIAYARAFRDRVSESTLLANRANRLLIEGRLDDAATAYEEALQVFRAIGNTRGVGFVLGGLGTIQAVSDRTDEAVRTLTLAARAHRESSNRHNEIGVLADLGRVHHRRGDLDAAEATFGDAARLLDQTPAPVHAWRIHANRAAVMAERGDLEGATAALARAREQLAAVDDVLGPALLGAVAPYLEWARVPRADRGEAERIRARIALRLRDADPLADAPAGSEWPVVALLVARLRQLVDDAALARPSPGAPGSG